MIGKGPHSQVADRYDESLLAPACRRRRRRRRLRGLRWGRPRCRRRLGWCWVVAMRRGWGQAPARGKQSTAALRGGSVMSGVLGAVSARPAAPALHGCWRHHLRRCQWRPCRVRLHARRLSHPGWEAGWQAWRCLRAVWAAERHRRRGRAAAERPCAAAAALGKARPRHVEGEPGLLRGVLPHGRGPCRLLFGGERVSESHA